MRRHAQRRSRTYFLVSKFGARYRSSTYQATTILRIEDQKLEPVKVPGEGQQIISLKTTNNGIRATAKAKTKAWIQTQTQRPTQEAKEDTTAAEAIEGVSKKEKKLSDPPTDKKVIGTELFCLENPVS